MADASIDIRIFTDKEMLSVDMAELMDASIPNTGVIQGCEVNEQNGVLSIANGRIVVGGRLGVVTGGTIPIPTLSQQEQCYLLAVCELSNPDRPFYLALMTANEIESMGLSTSGGTSQDFNVSDGIGAAVLGHCTVNPATGLVSNWTAMTQATARKGKDWYNDLSTRITNLEQIRMMCVERKVNLPAGSPSTPSATNVDFGNDLPEGTKLVGIDVSFDNFHLPYVGYDSGSVITWISHMNKRVIAIRNRTSAWNNYTMVATLFYIVDPNPNS